MKKLISAIITGAVITTSLITGISAKCEKNDKAVVFKFDAYQAGTKDPYKTSAADDAVISVYTWGSGTLTFADNAFTLKPKDDGGNMFEGVINDAAWHLPVNEYHYLKIRYKTSAASTMDGSTTYYMPSNKTNGKISLKLSGNWEETIVDLATLSGLNWSSYKDDYEKSASLGTNKVRSFRFDFPKDKNITYTIAYIAYFKSEADAKAFNGTMASLDTKTATTAAATAAAKTTTTTTAPKTSDTASFVVAAAAIALGLAVVIDKKRVK
jgi:hypothetical protein